MWLSVADAGNGFKFYGKTTNVATISGNGNFSCNGGVACSGLTVSGALLVGTTNVATALGEKATITDLDLKAPKASPAFTGTATAANLTVNGPFRVIGNSTIIDNALTVGVGVPSTENALSILGNSLLTGNLQVNANITCNGALTVASTNVLTALGEKATTANLDLKAPKASPAFTGALTCAGTATLGGALTVSGSRDDVASNITNSQLNGFSSLYFNNTSGASASEVGQIYCGQTVGLNLTTNTAHPIRFTTYSNASTQFISILPSMEILGTGNRDVEISAPLKIKCLLTTIEQAVVIGGAAPIEATGLYVSNNAVINRNLTVVGNLTVSGFYPIKPYAALYVVGNAIATSTAVGFLAPSAFTMTRTGGNYGFTFATPHPNGNNFQIFATPRTAGGTTPFFTCTAKVETDTTAGTKFSVWCRNASNAIIDGDFWVHTVP